LVAGLRDLNEQDETARRLFENFSSRQRDKRVTTAAQAEWFTGAQRWEIVALLRKLDNLGAGEFKVGRRGSKTRIEWLFSIRSLAAAAQGAAGTPEGIDPTQVDDDAEDGVVEVPEMEIETEEGDWIDHSFQLRPDMQITIRLPVDLTSKEADRIGGFIRQLPFDA